MKYDASPYTHFLITAILCFAVLGTTAQVVNEDDLRKIDLVGTSAPIIEVASMPDGHTVLAICKGEDRILVIDTAGWSVVRSIPVAGMERGGRLVVSEDGRHVMVEIPTTYWSPTKGERVRTVVVEFATGQVVLDVADVNDGCLVPTQDAMATLSGSTVTVRAFGGATYSFEVPDAAFAIAASADGATLAISQRPTVELLEGIPSMRSDKKAIKPALKYRQLVGLHSLADGSLLQLVPEVYDMVKVLRFTADGSRLLVLSVPDPKSGYSWGSHVDQVDVATGAGLRASFMSKAPLPELAISADGSTLALTSLDGLNKRKLTLYDLVTADTKIMIDLEQKRRYDKGEGELHDSRLGYAWLQDGRLVIGQGAKLGCYRP